MGLFDNIRREDLERMTARIREIRTLYNLSEAEMIIVGQFQMIISGMGLTAELASKVLKATSAVHGALMDETKDMKL